MDKNKFISDRLDLFEALILSSDDILSAQIVQDFLNKLDIEAGKIENSNSNINRITLIDKAFKTFQETQGIRILTAFATDMMDIVNLGKEYYTETIGRQGASDQIENIINKTIGMIKDGPGQWHPKAGGFLDQLTKDPQLQTEVKKLAFKSITTGAGYNDLKNSLADFIEGTGQEPGEFYRHYERFAFDTYSQIDRLNSRLHADRLGLNYFFYNGGLIKDSRVFCIERAGKIFHVDRIQSWKELVNKFRMIPGKRKAFIKEYIGPIVEKGQEELYDPANDLGGIKCRHSADYVSDEVAAAYLKKQKSLQGEPLPVPVTKENIEEIQKRALEVGDELQDKAKSLAKQFDGTVTPINFKSAASIRRKAVDELNNDLSLVRDPVRTTIIVPFEKIEQVAAEMRKDPAFVRVKMQDGPEYFGYKGLIANYQTSNGTIGEIQVNSPGMLYAKEPENIALLFLSRTEYNEISRRVGLPGGKGHTFYEKIRKINLKKAAAEQLKTYDQLIDESKEYYRHFYGF